MKMTYPETIYESDDSWGDNVIVSDSERESVEAGLVDAFELEDAGHLDGEWTEWTLKTILSDGTAVYGSVRYTQGDGKTTRREWFYLIRSAADTGCFEKIDGNARDAWTPEDDEFKIAFATESGEWDVVETFEAANADAANTYAEENYDGQEWYVLDSDGDNING